MKMKEKLARILVLALSASAIPASAWWDTWVRAQKSEPVVQSFNAVELSGADKTLDDAQAQGGRGGKVAYLAPGAALSFEMDLKPSTYSVWFIARADEETWTRTQSATDEEKVAVMADPEHSIQVAGLPVFSSLTVTKPDGSQENWLMPITYRDDYRVVSKLYFPWHFNGKCRITVGFGSDSKVGLLLDRIEVRDVLGDLVRRPIRAVDAETAAAPEMLDAETAGQIRLNRQLTSRGYQLPPAELTQDERTARSDGIWEWMPDLNITYAHPRYRDLHACIGRDWPGLLVTLTDLYEQTGNPQVGMDAAVLLCAMAEKYPGLDHYYKETGQHSNLQRGSLSWGNRRGKSVYSGWAGGDLIRLANSAERLYSFMLRNRELAEYVQDRIAWVKTPADLIELIDTNILQHGIDAVNRDIIRSEGARARCLEVLGVELGVEMPDAPVFRTALLLTEDPSDKNLSYNSRGDVHYIGSTMYVGNGRPSGYLGIAGGFPTLIGDAGDLRWGRRIEEVYPSRVYEGFGAVLIEDGQDSDNPLVKRGFSIFRGLGRGHAHHDSLKIEIFAHGCRLAPGLGGRHEGRQRSSPNMRLNRMQNMVWIDNREFRNIVPGSTTSGTGWTESFSPCPGVQYTANRARATSHRDVSLYQRSTAMIDGEISDDRADFYVFDVFRVQGGKDHVYCFHGAYGETVESNVELKPAVENEISKWVLGGRWDKNPLEAPSADPLVMHWPLREGLQKSYQGDHHTADEAVGLTLTLFGRGSDHVYVGGAASESYPVEMPYLHVHSTGEEGRSSVYPAIMEPIRGKSAIEKSRALEVTPTTEDADRGVAVEVVTTAGHTDTLYSSRKPETMHSTDNGLTAAAEFAFVSEDAAGLRMAHLVGGTELVKDGLVIRTERDAYRSVIDAVNYDERELVLRDAFPEKILDAEVALISTPYNQDTWNLESVAGNRMTVQKRIEYYQSVVEDVAGEIGMVSTTREPDIYGTDTEAMIGTVIANEAGRTWRATFKPVERWMYLGWPNTDLSFPRVVNLEDVPDVNGDGRRTLKLMGLGNEAEPRDKVMLELEVTRVDPENFTFYFKMPQDENYQIGGWQYANRWLVNEDGSKRWLATFPGVVNSWMLDGAEDLTLDDFPDIAGDGRRKLRAYHFGAGDTVEVKTYVHVMRTDEGYEIRANVPCTVKVPGLREVTLSSKDLADGLVLLSAVE